MADWSLSPEEGGRYEEYSRPLKENVCRRDYWHYTSLCPFCFCSFAHPSTFGKATWWFNWLNKSPWSGLSAKPSKTNPSFVLQNWERTVLRSGSHADVIRPETGRRTEANLNPNKPKQTNICQGSDLVLLPHIIFQRDAYVCVYILKHAKAISVNYS